MFDSCVFSKAVLCEHGVRVARERGQMPIPVFSIVKSPSDERFSYKFEWAILKHFKISIVNKGRINPWQL
jgi:hypothetical protein